MICSRVFWFLFYFRALMSRRATHRCSGLRSMTHIRVWKFRGSSCRRLTPLPWQTNDSLTILTVRGLRRHCGSSVIRLRHFRWGSYKLTRFIIWRKILASDQAVDLDKESGFENIHSNTWAMSVFQNCYKRCWWLLLPSTSWRKHDNLWCTVFRLDAEKFWTYHTHPNLEPTK